MTYSSWVIFFKERRIYSLTDVMFNKAWIGKKIKLREIKKKKGEVV